MIFKLFKLVCFVILAILCLHADKELQKATENKDLHKQIKYGVYLIIGIIVMLD